MIKKIDKNGYSLTVVQDEAPVNPFTDWDFPKTFGIDLSNHRDYRGGEFGEKAPISVSDFINYLRNPKHGYTKSEQRGFDTFQEEYAWEYVYMLNHSGISVNTTGFNDPWDSGVAGIAFIKKSVVAEEQLSDTYLKSQVQLLDWVFRGECYGFVITRYTRSEGETVVDSCYGFWGDPEDAFQEGLGAIDALPEVKDLPHLSDRVKESLESVICYCSDPREFEDWEEQGYPNNHIIHDAAILQLELLGDDSLMKEIDHAIPAVAPDWEPED